jgi:RNA recognition motif-containing protein
MIDGRQIFVSHDSRSALTDSGTKESTTPRVFIGNLAFETTWKELKNYIRIQVRDVGSMKVQVVGEDEGKSKGYALVSFDNENTANTVIQKINGTTLQGRKLNVRMDRTNQKDLSSPSAESSRGRGSTNDEERGSRQVYVRNIPFETKWKELKEYFRLAGNLPVEHAEVIESKGGRKTGFGIVRFYDSRDALEAIRKLDGTLFQGREITLKIDEQPERLVNTHTGRAISSSKAAQSKKASKKTDTPSEGKKPYDREAALSGALTASR